MTRVALPLDALRAGSVRQLLLLAAVCCAPLGAWDAAKADEIKVPDNEIQHDPASWMRPVPEDLKAADLKGILYERWDGVPGPTVRQLLQSPAFKQLAPTRGIADLLEFPAGDGKDFGVRARGYITPQRSGKVRFFISSDDNSEFWLSPNDDPFSKKKICWLTGPGWFGSAPRDLTNRIFFHSAK